MCVFKGCVCVLRRGLFFKLDNIDKHCSYAQEFCRVSLQNAFSSHSPQPGPSYLNYIAVGLFEIQSFFLNCRERFAL